MKMSFCLSAFPISLRASVLLLANFFGLAKNKNLTQSSQSRRGVEKKRGRCFTLREVSSRFRRSNQEAFRHRHKGWLRGTLCTSVASALRSLFLRLRPMAGRCLGAGSSFAII